MKLKINGVERQVAADWQNENLLTVLREHFGLTGSRAAHVWCMSTAYR